MPMPGMDGVRNPSARQTMKRESQSADMAFLDSIREDFDQDWSQWMRWDDQTFNHLPDHVNESSNPNPTFDLSSMSSASRVNSQGSTAAADFSPGTAFSSLDRPFEPVLGAPRGRMPSITSNYGQPLGFEKQSSMSMSPPDSVPANRKRKSTSDEDGSTVDDHAQESKKMPSKKRSHNVIEKRYRANLNEKIAELRDSVPSLRVLSKQSHGNSPDDDDAEGVTPANKLNKASILSKATEYIHHLELRNKRLDEENMALKTRLRQLDKALDQSVTSVASASSPSNCTVSTESGSGSSPSVFSHTEEISHETPSSSLNPPEGLIKVPDYIKKMRASSVQQGHYAESYIQYRNQGNEYGGDGRRRSVFPNKYMVGALAGLMVLETMSPEKKTESTEKGLLAVPMGLWNQLDFSSVRYIHALLSSSLNSWHVRAILHFLLTATFVVGCAFFVFLYLFNSRPRRPRNLFKTASATNSDASSPFNFRQQAWLTSIQQVGVPRHRFFLEWFAVTSRCFEYCLRCLLGWKLYSHITGITEEDEKGRVKTWDIAIDAQLAGGDPEISKSRLVLTIFAAGTLPRSPLRMMLKALHCRILLWRVGDPGTYTFKVTNDVARYLANYQWQMARIMNKRLPKDHPDALPSHLAALLQVDCEDVMIDPIVQRAANLTWNRPTQEAADDDEALLDVVVEDPAIQSALDSLAAWWSSHILQRALLRSFEASSAGPSAKKSRDLLYKKINMAVNIAPRPSAAYTRALVMKAVFFEEDRIQNIGAVLAALPSPRDRQRQASNFLDSSIPVSVREEISIAVRCAMIAAIFKARATDDTALPTSLTLHKAVTWFNQLPIDPVELTILGFAAIYHILHVVATDQDLLSPSSSDSGSSSAPSSSSSRAPSNASSADDEADDEPPSSRRRSSSGKTAPQFGRVASDLVYWARHAYNPAFYGFTSGIIEIVEAECAAVCESVGVDIHGQLTSQSEKLRNVRREERKKRRAAKHRRMSRQECEDYALGRQEAKRSRSRSQSLSSNDTGYGSISQEEEGCVPDESQEVQQTS
ncbi:transcriptional regulator family: Helix-loop-helix [Paecilomyces variotii]|nr:transcriptional regulator family: Helix-loop-helix [Paecilomyces variotii]KAJ9213529.1 transcriptional regulator family: Helix-loop-helix [Paecilomyces variotii]KAJ9233486.1 transcriptional regulator family: Helix-loop-helix [Paecilomyces variotii]KAJ9265225.1 transcriptional regulator family: Helix-loop-helix [Paecilomyces variotii]KAJ9307891.1 transcriptional regulator family: Helix-loop-helix [Paecilomyces variotii]